MKCSRPPHTPTSTRMRTRGRALTRALARERARVRARARVQTGLERRASHDGQFSPSSFWIQVHFRISDAHVAFCRSTNAGSRKQHIESMAPKPWFTPGSKHANHVPQCVLLVKEPPRQNLRRSILKQVDRLYYGALQVQNSVDTCLHCRAVQAGVSLRRSIAVTNSTRKRQKSNTSRTSIHSEDETGAENNPFFEPHRIVLRSRTQFQFAHACHAFLSSLRVADAGACPCLRMFCHLEHSRHDSFNVKLGIVRCCCRAQRGGTHHQHHQPHQHGNKITQTRRKRLRPPIFFVLVGGPCGDSEQSLCFGPGC